MHFHQNSHHHQHHPLPTTHKSSTTHYKSPSSSTAPTIQQLASGSDDIIGFSDDDNAVGNGSVDVGSVTGGVVDDDVSGLVGVTTWFHAGVSGKVSTTSSHSRGYWLTYMPVSNVFCVLTSFLLYFRISSCVY